VVAETIEAPVPAPSSSERRRIMVIDDSPTIRKILSLTLESAGYSVLAEADGESGLKRLANEVPDLVLLDIAMPGIDGYETCKRIKGDSRTSHLPVLMLSGKDALFDKVKGHMAGANEYLTKPFEAATVLAAVAGACPAQVR
jgi:twitching motility two-component system response regulator PilG